MEALLAWQPPWTNGSRYLCSLLCLTIFKNTGERKRGKGGKRRTLRDKRVHARVYVLVARRVGVTCSLENNDIVLNYNVMCMHWNSTLMIYTHSSYFYNINIQESIQCACLDDDLIWLSICFPMQPAKVSVLIKLLYQWHQLRQCKLNTNQYQNYPVDLSWILAEEKIADGARALFEHRKVGGAGF